MILIITISIAILLLSAVGVFLYIVYPKFGRLPNGKNREKFRNSTNYRDEHFQNINHTLQLTESVWKIVSQPSSKQKKPKAEMPVVKTDLVSLTPKENLLIWFGHSSCFLQLDGKRFLIDPVFSSYASPVSFINKAFIGTNIFKSEDIPNIDYLLITHDHWDHLDYKTAKELILRVKKVVCPLGVGAHLARWGYVTSDIIEMDWNERIVPDQFVEMICLPARHFSGRGVRQKKTLWASFLIKSLSLKIFISGDGGYDTHFASIGEQIGEIDFALIENGQYDNSWKYIHMHPEEVLQAGIDLRAKYIIPVHHSKFSISKHCWKEPLQRIIAINEQLDKQQQILTPKIGEIVFLNDPIQSFTRWWEEIE
ncbi:MAG: MBL fold metallo-hydrolase [Bacteroidales bacterium]|jgi:L-ascorbate metabolism protein UlaG (beta-lactamase superfamily)|nr:MBL fold metallo-hydrolase [Bacteroidales bacterium]